MTDRQASCFSLPKSLHTSFPTPTGAVCGGGFETGLSITLLVSRLVQEPCGVCA